MEKLSLIQKALRKVGLKAVEVKLEQATLADGVTVVEYESLEVGMPISIVTDNGMVPMPVGEYQLDMNLIKVLQEGIIGEIMPIEQTPSQEPQAPTVQAEQAPTTATDQIAKKTVESTVKETYFEEVEQLKAENAQLKSEIEALKQVDLSTHGEQEKPAKIQYNPEAVAEQTTWLGGKESLTEFLNKRKQA